MKALELTSVWIAFAIGIYLLASGIVAIVAREETADVAKTFVVAAFILLGAAAVSRWLVI